MNTCRAPWSWIVALVLVAVALPGRSQDPEYGYKKILALGDPAPGGGTVIFDLEPWAINDQGECTFGTDVTEGDGAAGGEIVVKSNAQGKLKLLARSGAAAPGGGIYGQAFNGLLALNDAGDVAFIFPLLACGNFCAGLFVYRQEIDELVPVMRPGRPAPGGGNFIGGGASPRMNNKGQIVFGALIDDQFDPIPPPGMGYGLGIFLADVDGSVKKIVRPGDPAPGGIFDTSVHPSINDQGDIAFGAHIQDQTCQPPHAPFVGCSESLYLRYNTGEIVSIAHQEEAGPDGVPFRIAFGAIINNRREILFVADFSEKEPWGTSTGIFLYRDAEKKVIPIARPRRTGFPGDEMPGGGRVVTCTFNGSGGHDFNQLGGATFGATLDSKADLDGDGTAGEPEQGLYYWKDGQLKVVARTGSPLGEAGTCIALVPPDFIRDRVFPGNYPWPFFGGPVNVRGEVLFAAAFRDPQGNLGAALFVATPKGSPAPRFRRGDVDGNGVLDISDPINNLSYQFLGGLQPPCRDALDDDDSGKVDISDAVWSLTHQFLGGPPPLPPGPKSCGVDPQAENPELGCVKPCA